MSCAAVRTITAVWNPRSASTASSSARATFSADRIRVLNRTLPVWMWVATSSWPMPSTQARRSAIAILPLPPTLTPRSRAT